MKRILQNRSIWGLVLAVSLFAGCISKPARSSTSPAGRIFKDDLGNIVEIPANVTRAVSLAPNLTEIFFAIGAGDRLVGVTTFCNYPGEAARIAKVGDTLKPNIESIIALRPQVVFVTTASQLESFSSVLQERGIKVFVTNPDSIESVYVGIRKIGEITGKTENAEVLISQLGARVRSAGEYSKKTPGSKRVFVQIDPSLYTIGKGSFISGALSKIGYESVTNELENPYPKISKEHARALNPDLIIVSESVGNDTPNPVFDQSVAVISGRVHKIDADVLSRPGPRFVDALEDLVKRETIWHEDRKKR